MTIGLFFGLAVLPVVLSLVGPTFVPRTVSPVDEKETTEIETIPPPSPIKVQPNSSNEAE